MGGSLDSLYLQLTKLYRGLHNPSAWRMNNSNVLSSTCICYAFLQLVSCSLCSINLCPCKVNQTVVGTFQLGTYCLLRHKILFFTLQLLRLLSTCYLELPGVKIIFEIQKKINRVVSGKSMFFCVKTQKNVSYVFSYRFNWYRQNDSVSSGTYRQQTIHTHFATYANRS